MGQKPCWNGSDAPINLTIQAMSCYSWGAIPQICKIIKDEPAKSDG
jgi:hypothetical protein